MKTLLDCLFVALGGAIGSVSRYLLGRLPVKTGDFPVITLGINVIGAFCIGLIVTAVGKHSGWDPRLVLFLKVGFCGGFTTFSTFSLETVQLLQNGKTAQAVLYVAASVVLGIAAVLRRRSACKTARHRAHYGHLNKGVMTDGGTGYHPIAAGV